MSRLVLIVVAVTAWGCSASKPAPVAVMGGPEAPIRFEGEFAGYQDLYSRPEVMPALHGGLAEMVERVQEEVGQQRCPSGRLLMRFVVLETGRVGAIELLEGEGHPCQLQALRVMADRRFDPGTVAGEPVKTVMSMPVTFRSR